jgi:putative membrane protein
MEVSMSTLRAALTTCAVIAMSAGGVAYADSPSPTPTPTPTPTPGVSAQDKSFLVDAHQGNLTEIAAGKLAMEKGNATDVRSMGDRMVTDHTKLDSALKTAATKLNVPLPAGPSPTQKTQYDRLAAMTGPAFDRAWVNAMIKDHRMALASGEKQLREGNSPEAKQVAASSAPVIKTHLSLLLQARGTIERPTGSPTPTLTHTAR